MNFIVALVVGDADLTQSIAALIRSAFAVDLDEFMTI